MNGEWFDLLAPQAQRAILRFYDEHFPHGPLNPKVNYLGVVVECAPCGAGIAYVLDGGYHLISADCKRCQRRYTVPLQGGYPHTCEGCGAVMQGNEP